MIILTSHTNQNWIIKIDHHLTQSEGHLINLKDSAGNLNLDVNKKCKNSDLWRVETVFF